MADFPDSKNIKQRKYKKKRKEKKIQNIKTPHTWACHIQTKIKPKRIS